MSRLLIFLLSLFLVAIMNNDTSLGARKLTKPNLKGFDTFVNKIMSDWKAPALAVAIVKDGKPIYTKGYGYRDINKKLPVTTKTIFGIGSTTKAFTSVLCGMLVDEKKLDWDKAVSSYIPEFKLYDTYASDHATLRDLLSHRTGLPRHDFIFFNNTLSLKGLVERLRFLEPNKELRQLFQYNNMMYATTGYIIEKISEKSWENNVKEKILDPLEMKSTNTNVEELITSDNYAKPYMVDEDTLIELPKSEERPSAAGAISSNVEDMAKWLIFNLDKGKINNKQIISEKSINEIFSPQMITSLPRNNKELYFTDYGFAWMLTSYRGNTLITHDGSFSGYMTSIMLLPDQKAGVVVLSSGLTQAPDVIAYNILDRILGLKEYNWNKEFLAKYKEAFIARDKLFEQIEKNQIDGTQPTHALKDYIGIYNHPAYGDMVVTMENNALKLTYYTVSTILNHYEYDIFQASEKNYFGKMLATFDYNSSGKIDRLSLPLDDAVKPIIFEKAKENNLKQY